LPALPNGVTGEQLPLEPRTRNCLAKRGLLDAPEKLANITVGEVLRLPAFGTKCLVDLLTCLASVSTAAATKSTDVYGAGAKQIKKLCRKIQRTALKLQRLKNASLIVRDDPRFGHFVREICSDAKNARQAADVLVSGSIAPANLRLVLR